MERFRAAALAHDIDALVAELSDDVVLHSPILFKPIVGKGPAGVLLRAVMQVFSDFTYVAHLDGSGKTALVFHAKVGKFAIEGVDLLTFGPDGLVRELTVFLRPFSATQAFLTAMQAELAAQS